MTTPPPRGEWWQIFRKPELDALSLLNLQARHMTAAVLLVEALGGGWTNSELPAPDGE